MQNFLSILMLLSTMVSTQVGASLAKQLFPLVGAPGAASLRIFFASIFLCLVRKPWRSTISHRQYKTILFYGLSLGVMNLTFYLAIQRLPLGIAVAIEFLGPLCMALYLSRHGLDILWALCAGLGIFLMLPFSRLSAPLDPMGIFFCLFAGVCWALYIQFGKRSAMQMDTGTASSLGMLVAAFVVMPFGISSAGSKLFNPNLLPTALALAILSSAFPYSVEMIVLKRVPARSFGILMSLAPALSAVSGFVLLHEILTNTQMIAILFIVTASMGSALTSRET